MAIQHILNNQDSVGLKPNLAIFAGASPWERKKYTTLTRVSLLFVLLRRPHIPFSSRWVF